MRKAVDMAQAADLALQQPLVEPPLEQLADSVALEATPTLTRQVHSVNQLNQIRQVHSAPEHLVLEVLEDSAPPTPALSVKALHKQPVDLEPALPVPLDLVQREEVSVQIHPEHLDHRLEQVLLVVLRNLVPLVSAEDLDRTLPTLLQEDLEHLPDPPLEHLPIPIQPVLSVQIPLRQQPTHGGDSVQTLNLVVELLVQIQQLKRTNLRSADSAQTHRTQRHPQQEDLDHSVKNPQ